jgi:glutamate dehydrogenase
LVHVEVLNNIKKKLRADTFTRQYILDIIAKYPNVVRACYSHLANIHYKSKSNLKLHTEEEILNLIKKTTENRNEAKVFESFITFNKSVLKTNFYNSAKVALSFRLDPSFMSDVEFPRPLYGMFLVVGSGFRGFHLRFRDIARGGIWKLNAGIRIVRSRNRENYSINLRNLLDENYGLAATQQRKNKDIPEGGSKGTILLDANNQDNARVSFEKYVDSILDLLVPREKGKMVDLYKQEEILFLGPDEGTAEMMDWASQHARARYLFFNYSGAHFWNAFTTGKSPKIGGIPHDAFGMTTRSVHQYVLGIYRKMGLEESEVTKLQIGGPDGDLGSNEIKLSKDKTIGIVDGSGVAYDPNGLDREELLRLAGLRVPIINFDNSKLSPKGFSISVDAIDVKLPDGTIVSNGEDFRNKFHLNPLVSADLFVPCIALF